MQNARLYKLKTGIKIARKNVNSLRYTDDTTLMAQSKEELKAPLIRVKGERKVALKIQHSRNEISGSGSHHFRANRWEKSGSCGRLYLGGCRITADRDCSHEIKRCLPLGRKTYDKPRQHIRKQRHYCADQAPHSQSYGFSTSLIWMWELDHKEGWVSKNWCFLTVVLEKTQKSLSDCKEIQQVHLKGDQFWILLEGLMLKVKFAYWCEEPTHWKRLWCWERLREGGKGDDRGWDGWMASLTQWTWVWASSGRWWRTGRPGGLQSLGLHRVGPDLVTGQPQLLTMSTFKADIWELNEV